MPEQRFDKYSTGGILQIRNTLTEHGNELLDVPFDDSIYGLLLQYFVANQSRVYTVGTIKQNKGFSEVNIILNGGDGSSGYEMMTFPAETREDAAELANKLYGDKVAGFPVS